MCEESVPHILCGTMQCESILHMIRIYWYRCVCDKNMVHYRLHFIALFIYFVVVAVDMLNTQITIVHPIVIHTLLYALLVRAHT